MQFEANTSFCTEAYKIYGEYKMKYSTKKCAKPASPNMENKEITQIIRLMMQLRQTMHQQCREGKNKMSFPQLAVLHYINERKAVLMKDIAKELAITAPSATVFVEVLSKDGLIVRRPDPNDGRIVMLKLTPKGTKFLKDNISQMNERIKKDTGVLTSEERKTFARILEKIINRYETKTKK